MEDKFLLDLNTIQERAKIKIDGEIYELRNREEFSIVDFGWFAETGKQIGELSNKTTDPASLKRLIKLLDLAVDKSVVDIPAKIIKALTTEQKILIIQVFSKVAMPKPEKAEAAKK